MTPSYRAELLRKSIHISSLWMSVALYWLPQAVSIALFAALTLSAFGIEYIRRRTPHINAWFDGILRAHEKGETHNHVGATWMLLGALFASFFPDFIAVTAMTTVVVCDTAASLVGMRFGKKRRFGKSLEGSFAFFASGLLVIAVLGSLFPGEPAYAAAALFALSLATLSEFFSAHLKLDDNLLIPLIICAAIYAFTALA